MTDTYHSGMRQLQDRFDSRRIADRLDERLGRTQFTPDDRAFIESRPLFFLASADAQGRPDCSHKGGDPGFVRVTSDNELAFPSYDGNGMFRSLGNVLVNPAVGTVNEDDALLGVFTGAQLVVRVRAERIFPNCPRYIHRAASSEPSPYVPRPGSTPPEPKWKRMEMFADALPRDPFKR